MTPLERLTAGEPIEVPVDGHSMRPLLRSGDVVRVRPLRDHEPERGQIVLKVSDGQWVLHRLVQASERRVQTRGDSRLRSDAPSERAAVIGVADAVRHLGRWWSLEWPPSAAELWMRAAHLVAAARDVRDRRRRRRKRATSA